MSTERGFDITDPKQWNAMPASQKISAITEMQSILVTESLKHTSIGKALVERRQAGHRLDREVLIIEHRDEPTVDAKTRKAMIEREMMGQGDYRWRPRLYALDNQPPRGASKEFKHWFTMAKKYPPRPGTDLHCIIASEKKVFLVGVSLDKYLEALNPSPPPGAAETIPAPAETQV